jgi:hypothetical protein
MQGFYRQSAGDPLAQLPKVLGKSVETGRADAVVHNFSQANHWRKV